MALFASLIMFSFFLIHHKVACDEPRHHISPQALVSPLAADMQALLRFTAAVESKDVNWNESLDVCSEWKGIKCDVTQSFVTWIQLPRRSLRGEIPEDTIGSLNYLTILSLHGNNLSGSIPSDFSTLKNLIRFDLHSNNFTGDLPEINVMKMDERNFNVSNNKLTGVIPTSMSDFYKSSFDHNFGLCGLPLDPCRNGTKRPPSSSPPLPIPSSPENKLPKGARIGIAVGSPLLVLVILSWFRKDLHLMPEAIPKKSSSSSSKGDNLVEEDGMICSLGLEDLLLASEADLGEGKLGTTYKALMIKEEVVDVVVKKLNDVVVTKKEFESHMEILGKKKNQNVVPLRAYHCCEVEKLLVYDYFPAGSVHDLLHGSRGSGQTPVDWNQRMQIALNAARGLRYLHFIDPIIVHGNFKSSNILLQHEANKEAAVSDYGLNMLFARSSSIESDVYRFGVFLLELLTRKDPNQDLLGEEKIDLPRWVKSYAQEEWKTKVFDTELITSYQNVEEKMVELLKIALECASLVPNDRPPMDEVVRKMEDMNPN